MAKAFVALIVWLSIALPVLAAQSTSPPKKAPRPAWSELTPEQQKVLAPLQSDWDSMDTTRRRKWVAIANRYPKMTPAAQQRLQKRMTDWAKLTPAQRQEAREKYLKIRKLPPKQRQEVREQWDQYQESLAPPTEPAPEPAPAEAGPAQAESAEPATGSAPRASE